MDVRKDGLRLIRGDFVREMVCLPSMCWPCGDGANVELLVGTEVPLASAGVDSDRSVDGAVVNAALISYCLL